MKTEHQYLDKYPISVDSEKLIVGTIHPHNHDNFRVPFFYGNKLSIWKILNTAFNCEMGQSITLESIIEFLANHKISVSDTIVNCERKNPTALDSDLIPLTLNHGIIDQIKNSKIKEVLFTSGFQVEMFDLFESYPKTAFRFRPYSPLSLKELQYNELFFVARDELNDPYDTKSPALFSKDVPSYVHLINSVLYRSDISGNSAELFKRWKQEIDVDLIANYLAREDHLYDELIEVLKSEQFEAVVFEAFKKVNFESIALSLTFIKSLKCLIYKYGTKLMYVSSFSKEPDNPVMWSHYSNQHKGFCLCFSIEDNTFNTKSNQGQTRNFRFDEVDYVKSNVTVNGFDLLPGRPRNVTFDVNSFNADFEKSYLTKFESWRYENEIRLVHHELFQVNSEGPIKKPFIDRTFHYDLKQLTGIIFGSEMKKAEKEQLRSIVYQVRADANLTPPPLFIFYQAMESVTYFKMNIAPIQGLDCTNKFFEMNELATKRQMCASLNEHYKRNHLQDQDRN